ncbi:cell division cycle and apoptosis regulator protein 1-like [Armigeres subalbatus]|uniref:cell division cycle and apoptosis regulator protein 1-like n=1 Tax=Armigeres subalbatus TaxID=124917 RepID=UPI002ED24872
MAFNQKNPPWQRNAGQSIAGMQTIVSFPQAQPVFNQGMGLQQQQNLSLIPQMGLQQQQIYSQAVQYPTSRPINTLAFQNQQQAQQSAQINQGSSKFNPNQRVFSGTGHVTKVQNDFGFIDEEVFFHKNVCKGLFPKVGDRVLVEAAYNQNMPFKWNATRVQVLQSASSSSANSGSSSRHASNYGTTQTSSADRSGRSRYSPRKSSPDRHGHRSSNRDSRDDDDRRRRREDRDADRHRDKRDRSSERDRRDRERSPVRKLSPKRRKVRPIPRYMVQMPKQLLTLKSVDILELRRRYHTLYIPSDFFSSEIRWVDAFPPNAPYYIRKPCAFHVMHKDVEPLTANDANLEPADADYLYSAKVMLMGTPPLADFYQKCFTTTEDRERHDEDPDHVHPTRLINFLVGIRGKNETMAIGGPWSPSLDGENPHSNPNVLIKTAIRTCKGLTGIDLSNCTRWYRFVELYYRRSETYHKGRLIPARIEMVVIFLPDVRSCQPTNPEWDELHLSYKSHLERIINSQNSDSPVPAEGSSTDGASGDAPPTQQTSPDGDKVASSETKTSADAATAPAAAAPSTDNSEAAKGSTNEKADSTVEAAPIKEEAEEAAEDNEKDDAEADKASAPAELDLKKMKVADLKAELLARNLPTDGVKNTLMARLAKALKQETNSNSKDDEDKTTGDKKDDEKQTNEKEATQESEKPAEKDDEEFETMDNVDMSEVTVIDEYDSKSDDKTNDEASKKAEPTKLTEKERQVLEKRYSLPEQPHIIVHPSKTAKSGKFDCAVMSLSVLLDYRPEDSKEHSFEVSLFAELFNEMLTRDFGFNIYKALHMLPSKKEEEPKKESTAEEVKEDDDKKVNGDGSKEKAKSSEESTKSKDDKDDKEKDRARDRDRDSRKRSRFDDSAEEERRRKEKEKEKERERLKYYTADRDLLLSFTYFDISHCGYIFDKDVEDLFYTIGLNLSRSQIRRLVSKAVTRDSLYYRKLTDKVKELTEEEKESDGKEKEGEQKETVAEATDDAVVPVVKPEKIETVELTEADLEVLATGNCNLVEQMKINLQAVLESEIAEAGNDPPTKKIKLEPLQDDSDIPETNNGLVLHNGGVLDIPKLLEQMRRTEKAREDADQLLIDLRKQNLDLTKSQTRSNDKIKDQAGDIKSLTRKLVDAEQNLRDVTKKSNEYFSTLSSVYDRVSVVMHRADPKRSSSISSSRRGSSRDRSGRKDDKSKDKESETTKDSLDKAKPEEPKKSNDSPTAGSESKASEGETKGNDESNNKNAEKVAEETKQAEQKVEEEKKE